MGQPTGCVGTYHGMYGEIVVWDVWDPVGSTVRHGMGCDVPYGAI